MHATRAFTSDTSLQGFIWVEAHKMDYVRDALRGLRLIFHSKPVHQVPLAQMVETIAVPKPSQALLGAHLLQCFCRCCFVISGMFNRAYGGVVLGRSTCKSSSASQTSSKQDAIREVDAPALQSGTAGRA
jgi:Early transcription elongation factor of RNA pol II, NGN section